MAGAENGMQIVDISNPISPTLVSVYDRPGPSGANAIAIVGDWAYVADDGEGLRIVDVSDPNHPTEVGSYDTPGYAERGDGL